MGENIQYGKISTTKVVGDKTIETTKNIVAGEFVPPNKIHTEESIEIFDRADQDAEYIKFADEEERLQKAGKLVEAEFQVRRTPSSVRRGARYAIKKFTILDSGV
jgi:hypothetical protein